jgi:hypothetical protein
VLSTSTTYCDGGPTRAAWAAIAQNLQPGLQADLVGCEPRGTAEQALADARHNFDEATGCLD